MIGTHPFKMLNTAIFYLSCVVLLTSCWHRNEFTDGVELAPAMLAEPVQTAVDESSFRIHHKEIGYEIQPRYTYDLTGLVVSYEFHNSKFGLHKLWNDHINVADICVVWDENVRGLDLNAFDFWNGAFTCNVQTRDTAAWRRFNINQLANNHLLVDDAYLRKAIGKVRIGDQVRIRGWLADYRNEQGFTRETSTTRKDTGNGACETIYVKKFDILRSLDNGWRTLLTLSLLGVIASAGIWLIWVVRGDY